MNGEAPNAAKIKIITGEGNETYHTDSKTKLIRTKVYDAGEQTPGKATLSDALFHVSNIDNPREFMYENFRYNKSGITPIIFYNQEDRIHVGLSHKKIFQRWDKTPYHHSHTLAAKYSVEQKGFSLTYKGSVAQFPGNWFTNLYVNWDQIRWQNFFGLGNETVKQTNDMDYYRIRSRQFIIQPSLERIVNNRHKFVFAPFYQLIDIIQDNNRYMYLHTPYNFPANYQQYKMAGASAEYLYQRLNDSILPIKGFVFNGIYKYNSNITDHNFDHSSLNGMVNLLMPVSKTIGLNLQLNGESILSGTQLLYQYAKVGGNSRLRGMQRHRLQGNHAFSSQNELRWIKDVRSYYYNGKIGIFGLYDIGRVWLDNENSNKWHSGIGGGIILSPFNKISGSIAYAKTKNDHNLHIALIAPL